MYNCCRDDDDANDVPWWLGLVVPVGAWLAWWHSGEATTQVGYSGGSVTKL